MTTAEIRNQKFRELQGQLRGIRARVYESLVCWGPTTTRRLAELSGIDLLTLRPRMSELLDVGLARLEGDVRGEEGVYAAVPLGKAVDLAVDRTLTRHEQMALL